MDDPFISASQNMYSIPSIYTLQLIYTIHSWWNYTTVWIQRRKLLPPFGEWCFPVHFLEQFTSQHFSQSFLIFTSLIFTSRCKTPFCSHVLSGTRCRIDVVMRQTHRSTWHFTLGSCLQNISELSFLSCKLNWIDVRAIFPIFLVSQSCSQIILFIIFHVQLH